MVQPTVEEAVEARAEAGLPAATTPAAAPRPGQRTWGCTPKAVESERALGANGLPV